MNYYSMQVITHQEKRFMQLAENAIAQFEKEQGVKIIGKLLWPRRSLKIRKRGKTTQEQAPIFPGYLFWQAESLEPEVYWLLKKNSGFIRFLKSNYDIEPLTGASKELLVHFLNYGEVVGTSTVTFGTGDRIVVLSGPMKGLEGNIRKVNKRKGRAKIELMLYEQSFLIDFAFDGIKKAEGKEHE